MRIPKPQNRYKPIAYNDDIDDGVFDFKHYGNNVYRPTVRWANRPRQDLSERHG